MLAMEVAKGPVDFEPKDRADVTVQHFGKVSLNLFMNARPKNALVASLRFFCHCKSFVVSQYLQ